MHKPRFTAAVAILSVLIVAVITTAPPADALGKFLSPSVGRAQVDPIVNHGQPTSAHMHLFFGNTKLLTMAHPESAEYVDLVGQGTAFDNPDDTAAYWVPDMVWTSGPLAGQSVLNKRIFAYYRSFDHKTTGQAEPLPPDLRLVAGNPAQPAAVPLDTSRLNWSCDDRSSRTGPYASIDAANCATATGAVYLTAHVDMPSCWDGLFSSRGDGNTSDMPHMAYATKSTCPAGFGHKLTELRETIKWGDGTAGFWQQGTVALSSDLMQRSMGNPVTSGQTLHADLLNSWLPSGGVHGGMAGMVASCIVSASKPAWCGS